FFNARVPRRALRSFPTRRSSDLAEERGQAEAPGEPGPALGVGAGARQHADFSRPAIRRASTVGDPVPAGPPLAEQLEAADVHERSEEHTSELQSPYDLVCRLLLE